MVLVLNIPIYTNVQILTLSAPQWMAYHSELTPSTTHPGMINLPPEGVKWLLQFLEQNGELLERKKDVLRTTKAYQWSPTDKVDDNVSLIELAQFGVKRALFSNDCIRALVEEIKILAPLAE